MMHVTIEASTQGVWTVRLYGQSLGRPRVIAAIVRTTPPDGGVRYVLVSYLREAPGRSVHDTWAECRERLEQSIADLLGLPPEAWDPTDPRTAILDEAVRAG